jgi:hypothetical protein
MKILKERLYEEEFKYFKGKSHDKIIKDLEKLSPKEQLFQGVENGYLYVVENALKLGIDPSIYNNYAIRIASVSGFLDIVKLLMKDPRIDPSFDKNWAFRYAIKYDHLKVAKELLKDKRVRDKLRPEDKEYLKNS